MKVLIAVVTGLVSVLNAFAAQQIVSGTVYDNCRDPVVGAEVWSDSAEQTRYTVLLGKFVLPLRANAKSPVTVTISMTGYKTWKDYIEIPQTIPKNITLEKVGKCDPPTRPAVPTPRPVDPARNPSLLELELKSTDPAKRLNALKVLATLGKEALPSAPAIAEAVRDPDASVRMQALITLRAIQVRSSVVRDSLLMAMRVEDVGCAAIQVLREIDKSAATVTQWNAVAADEQVSLDVRLCAAATVIEVKHAISPEGETAIASGLWAGRSKALELAVMSDASIRGFAEPLGRFLSGYATPMDMVKRILETVSRADEETQGRFAKTFNPPFERLSDYAVGSDQLDKGAREMLRSAMRVRTNDVISCGFGYERWPEYVTKYITFIDRAEKLGVMDARSSARTLLSQSQQMFCILRDNELQTNQAREVLAVAIQRRGEAALDPLRDALSDEKRRDRAWVAASLYVLTGGTDSQATGVLLAPAYDPGPGFSPIDVFARVRPIRDERVIAALEKSAAKSNEKAANALVHGLLDDSARERTAARLLQSDDYPAFLVGARLIEGLPKLAPGTVRLLLKGLESSERWRRGEQSRSLLTRHARSAVPVIAEELAKRKPTETTELLSVLNAMKGEAAPAVPAVTALLRTASQLDAIQTLAEIGAASTPAVPQMIEIVRSERSPNRAAAARALGAIGPNAAAAAVSLHALALAKDEVLRNAALEALAKIER